MKIKLRTEPLLSKTELLFIISYLEPRKMQPKSIKSFHCDCPQLLEIVPVFGPLI